jgi:hypothetical protein
MTKLNLQFHADPAELDELIPEWTEGAEVSFAAEEFFPVYRISPLNSRAGLLGLGGLRVVNRVVASRVELDTSASSDVEFFLANPGCLTVSFGRLADGGLRESAIGSVVEDRETAAIWRGVLRRAKGSMNRGAIVVDPYSSGRRELAEHPYTDGARRLADSGTKMLAAAGWNEYEFMPTSPDPKVTR